MFTRPNPVMKYDRIMLSGSLYVYITDIDAFYTGIKEKVTIVSLENFIYGMREFAIKDNNGFVIILDVKSKIANAIKALISAYILIAPSSDQVVISLATILYLCSLMNISLNWLREFVPIDVVLKK